MDNNLEDKLKEFKKGYLKKLESTLIEFKDLAVDFKPTSLDKIYSMVHTISGTSGIYGLSELSNISTEFEIYLKELKNDNSLIQDHELHEKFVKYITNIEDILDGE